MVLPAVCFLLGILGKLRQSGQQADDGRHKFQQSVDFLARNVFARKHAKLVGPGIERASTHIHIAG